MSYNKHGYTKRVISTSCWRRTRISTKDYVRCCACGAKPWCACKDRERDALLLERVERLMSIPAVGPITALTWALEIGDVRRFSSIKKAISYCGLCGAEKSSGNTVQRTPLSKQRNKHLQTTLIEAAKLAPRNSLNLAMLYHPEGPERQC